MSVIDVEANTAYALSVRQTPPTPAPAKQAKPVKSTKKQAKQAAEETRVDFYLKHLQEVREMVPAGVDYGVFDGYFAKKKLVDGVCAMNLHVVTKLRCDADLNYLYEGPQKPRGAHRKYAGKVRFNAELWSATGKRLPRCWVRSSRICICSRCWRGTSGSSTWCGCCSCCVRRVTRKPCTTGSLVMQMAFPPVR